MDFSTHKFRCSELSHLVSVKKPIELTTGNKTHLSNVFLSKRYGRKEIITTKHIEKGHLTERDSINLVQEYFNTYLKKNDQSFENDFIRGTPDCLSILVDVKSKWDLHTFHNSEITDLYFWQLQGYMKLLNREESYLCYCLNNTPADLINDEKYRLKWVYKVGDIESEEYKEACRQVEINSIFDMEQFLKENPYFNFHNDLKKWSFDIPKKDRLKVFKIPFEHDKMEMLEQKIVISRKYLNDLKL